jgi:hypothetical protein
MQLKSVSGSIASWVLPSHTPRLGSALAKSITISCHTLTLARLVLVPEPRPTKVALRRFATRSLPLLPFCQRAPSGILHE